jgi:hypothetical protein
MVIHICWAIGRVGNRGEADLKPWGGRRPVGRYPGGILRRNVRTKRTKRTKCPRTGFRRGGNVRLKRHKPPLFELKGDGTTALQAIHDGLAPRPGWFPVMLCGQVVKELRIIEDAWAHSCSSRNHLLTRWPCRWAQEYRAESVVNQFCLTMHSLRGPRNDGARKALGGFVLSVSWWWRHGTRGSVLSRAAPLR